VCCVGVDELEFSEDFFLKSGDETGISERGRQESKERYEYDRGFCLRD
jgi:hypothetical protein